jgi:hypothetical protein
MSYTRGETDSESEVFREATTARQWQLANINEDGNAGCRQPPRSRQLRGPRPMVKTVLFREGFAIGALDPIRPRTYVRVSSAAWSPPHTPSRSRTRLPTSWSACCRSWPLKGRPPSQRHTRTAACVRVRHGRVHAQRQGHRRADHRVAGLA